MVLRQCWVERIKPIIVLNKIDRLILEWKMSPVEAYDILCRLLENVNVLMAGFHSDDIAELDELFHNKLKVYLL